MNSRFVIVIAAMGISLAACSMIGGRPATSASAASTAVPSPIASPAGTAHPTLGPTDAAHASGLPSTGLDGHQFVSVLVTKDGTSIALVSGTKIRLGFSNGSISASAGCNSMSGDYEIQGGNLVVGELAITDMGCPASLADQDAWLATFLGSKPARILDGNDLTLRSDAAEITFIDRETAEPDQPLAGITWGLTTVINGDIASSVPVGMMATLLFDADGSFTYSDGCNSGGGEYSTNRDNVSFAHIVSTTMACDTTKEHAAVTDAIDAMLAATAIKFSIDHTSLTLQAGGHGLQYDAAVDVTN